MRAPIHIILHGLVPLIVAYATYRSFSQKTARALAFMLAGLLIDLDHFLANPIYDPNRCSIGFHPLHQAGPAVVYVALTVWPKTRWLGVGLVIHLVLDAIDCAWMKGLG